MGYNNHKTPTKEEVSAMKRRAFFKTTLALLAGTQVSLATAAPTAPRRIFILRTWIAGFQYYDGPQLDIGDHRKLLLTLLREPDNPYDQRAVALHWHHHKLGYIPRRHNHAIAQMLDHGEQLQANVLSLTPGDSPWQGWEIEIEALA